MIDGIRVTGLARTVAGTARMGDFELALTALDQGIRRGASIEALQELARKQARWHGIGVLRRALPLADRRSESVGESFSRALMLGFDDVPTPDLQVKLVINDGKDAAWADFCWERKLVGEFDGHIKYMRSRPFSTVAVEDVVYAEKLRECSTAQDFIRQLCRHRTVALVGYVRRGLKKLRGTGPARRHAVGFAMIDP